jgi:hypothetical protein
MNRGRAKGGMKRRLLFLILEAQVFFEGMTTKNKNKNKNKLRMRV